MFDFEHPFTRNGFPTFGEWHQGPSVIDIKIVIFFLHGNFLFICIFALQHLFHDLRFFWKSYGCLFDLFGGHPPITRPLLTLSLGPFSLSILLWFIQTFILWWNKFFFRKKIWCRFITFHVFHRFLLQRYRLASLTSSPSFTISSTTTCFIYFVKGVLSWTLSIFSVPSRNTSQLLMIFLVLHTSSNMLWSLHNT